MKHQDLTEGLKTLNLRRMAEDYAEIARLCEKDGATYEQYLAKLVAMEVEQKKANRVGRILKACNLPKGKILETYDYTKRTGVTREAINRLVTGEFLRDGTNVVFYGEFGVGKSHLAEAVTRRLCELGYRCWFTSLQALINDLLFAQRDLSLAARFKKLDRLDLITIDQLGYTTHTSEGADLFFELLSERYERKSVIITTNLTYSEWDKVFNDRYNAKAAVDRLIHRCETFKIIGPSWRAEEAKKRMERAKATEAATSKSTTKKAKK